MKSTFSVLAFLLLVMSLLHNGHAMPRICKRMSGKRTKLFEKVFGIYFMGCKLSPRQAIVVMSRINWMIPKGQERVIGIARDQTESLEYLDDLGKRKETNLARRGLRIAAISAGRPGLLTVSTDCIKYLEPDLVASILANARTSRAFNRMLADACVEKGVEVDVTTRVVTSETREVVRSVICIVGFVLSFFFNAITGPTLQIVKMIADTILVMIPCPSNVARVIGNVV